MAGHSKWAQIKRKKAVTDSKRGQLFTKLGRAIQIAARDGGGDIDGNPALALAVQKAKDAAMPKDNIERAIARGSGAGTDADAIESIVYEGYGQGGVALLIEALTDNRNRTSSDVKHALSKHGGSLGEPGSVAFQFDKRGVVEVDGERYDEDDLLSAVDAGAEDIVAEDGALQIQTEPALLTEVREALVADGVEVESSGLVFVAKSQVALDGVEAAKLLKLIDALEDLDDVDAVHANYDIPAEVFEALAAE